MMPTAEVLHTLYRQSEVVRWHHALGSANVPYVLLKGIGFDCWLDREGPSRDVDLLVPPTCRRTVEALLRADGFRRVVTEPSATTWISDDTRMPVDLHFALKGVGVPPAQGWHLLESFIDSLTVASVDIPVFGSPVRELHAVLHVALGGDARAESDLCRVLDRTSLATWHEVTTLAGKLGARRFLEMGLSVNARTRALAAQLGLRPSQRADRPLAVALLPLIAQRGQLERVAMLGRFLRVHPRAISHLDGNDLGALRFLVGRARDLPGGVLAARRVWRSTGGADTGAVVR